MKQDVAIVKQATATVHEIHKQLLAVAAAEIANYPNTSNN